MKKIEFRAWDKEMKVMHIVDRIQFDVDEIDVTIRKGKGCEEFYSIPFSEIELMQYTGIKDKNGKYIYEGDIVQIEHSERYGVTESVFEIKSDISLWGYEYDWELIRGYFCTTHILKDDYSNLAVIGNIYENPQLIK